MTAARFVGSSFRAGRAASARVRSTMSWYFIRRSILEGRARVDYTSPK
jgi:hypothetical protein